jgi:hypothetical protein
MPTETGGSPLKLAGITLVMVGIVLALIAIAEVSQPTSPPTDPPKISRICEEAIGKVADYSNDNRPSIQIHPSEACFGPVIRFPRQWRTWIFQQTGDTRQDSWLDAWPDGTLRPLPPVRSGFTDQWPNVGNAMRFAGRGTYLVIAIRQEALPSANVEITSYQNRLCNGAEDGQPNAILVDHSTESISEFTVTLQPGCFLGYVLLPEFWESYSMTAINPSEDWWMAYKWYQSKHSGSGERAPLKANDYLTPPLDKHTSQKVRVQGYGQVRFQRL